MTNLPDLHMATLDEGTLEVLFSDIDALGQDIEVVPKRSSRQRVENCCMTLAEAEMAIRAHSLRAVQVRYTYEGVRWCDTLLPNGAGWSLTRINLTEASTAE
ncbi:hypothetical protein NG895_10610 [Aeoliella sp. ICT_H6.2]|uniref:Uncharacterized protein n=1 Tax=Aeoliella straminimaris TaxID=2954799 RepID=A0A9X2FA02_9BACT|nr:hypothetical protein [Aeoliella straminimaris]MCO6044358.1 hypothetical protein [Aeoliella straminimaris]